MRSKKVISVPIVKGIEQGVDDFQINGDGFVSLENLVKNEKLSVESVPFFETLKELSEDEKLLKLRNVGDELLGFSWDKIFRIIGRNFTQIGRYLNADVKSFFIDQRGEDLTFPDVFIEENGNIHSVYRDENKLYYKELTSDGIQIFRKTFNVEVSQGKGKERFIVVAIGGNPIIIRMHSTGFEFFKPKEAENPRIAPVTFSAIFGNSYNSNSSDTFFNFSNEGGEFYIEYLFVADKSSGDDWTRLTSSFDYEDDPSTVARVNASDVSPENIGRKTAPDHIRSLTKFSYWDSFQYSGKNYDLAWNINNGYYLVERADDKNHIVGKFSSGFTSETLDVDWDFSGNTKIVGDDIYFPILINKRKVVGIDDEEVGSPIKYPLGVFIIKLSVNKARFVGDLAEVNQNLILASPAVKLYTGGRFTEFGFSEAPKVSLLSETAGIAPITENMDYSSDPEENSISDETIPVQFGQEDEEGSADDLDVEDDLLDLVEGVKNGILPNSNTEVFLRKKTSGVTDYYIDRNDNNGPSTFVGIDLETDGADGDSLITSSGNTVRIQYEDDHVEIPTHDRDSEGVVDEALSIFREGRVYEQIGAYDVIRYADNAFDRTFGRIFVGADADSGEIFGIYYFNRSETGFASVNKFSIKLKRLTFLKTPLNLSATFLPERAVFRMYDLGGRDTQGTSVPASSFDNGKQILDIRKATEGVRVTSNENDARFINGNNGVLKFKPSLVALREYEKSSLKFLDIYLKFDPSSDEEEEFTTERAIAYLQNLKIEANNYVLNTMEDDTATNLSRLVRQGNGRAVSGEENVFRYTFRLFRNSETIDASYTYDVTINQSEESEIWRPVDRNDLFSFSVGETDYTINDLYITPQKLTFDLTTRPSFQSNEISAAITINGERTSLPSVEFDGTKVNFSSISGNISELADVEGLEVEIEIFQTAPDERWEPPDSDLPISLTIEGEDYDVEALVVRRKSVTVSLNNAPQFAAYELVCEVIVGGVTSYLNMTEINEKEVTFSSDRTIEGLLRESQEIRVAIKKSSVRSDVLQNFTNVYAFHAAYRWKDFDGKDHYSALSEVVDVQTQNSLGAQGTNATIKVDSLQLTEKDDVEVVLFRQLLKTTNPLEAPGTLKEERSLIQDGNETNVLSDIPTERLISLALSYFGEIFQPEGAGAVELQHERVYLGKLNTQQDRVIASQPEEKNNPIFFTFTISEANASILANNVEALARVDSSLVIFTHRGNYIKSGAGFEPEVLSPSLHNSIKSGSPAVSTPIGAVYESQKGLYMITRGQQFDFIGFDVLKHFQRAEVAEFSRRIGGRLVDIHVSELEHLIYFMLEDRPEGPPGEVLVYNYLYRSWSQMSNVRSLADFKQKTYKSSFLEDFLQISTDSKEPTRDHVIETGWFDFDYPHGKFYLKGISFLGSFETLKNFKVFLFYNREPVHREVQSGVRTLQNPKYADPAIQYGQDIPRASGPKTAQTIKVIPRIQRVTSIKTRFIVNSNRVKISNIGFEFLPIREGFRQIGPQQLI